uniref:Uncharacterized protein n=1 Tax=Davidia involucrata TaxID=16924 RepID=A0A5B6ZCM7_DAVIN
MWRRLSTQLRTLAPCRSTSKLNRFVAGNISSSPSPSQSPFRPAVTLISRHFASDSAHEREELEAELEGRKILDIDYPDGPFGTKEAPAVIKSYYDKRIVGCPGGEGEDEHDVVWFWLEKGKPHECPVCSQYFVLEVVGPGGPPDGHGDDDDH